MGAEQVELMVMQRLLCRRLLWRLVPFLVAA
jgi:hypothetical protein